MSLKTLAGQINNASSTEATQLDVKAAIEAVNASTQQVGLLADAVFTMVQDLRTLLVCRGVSADLRVTPVGGTVSTVSTVSNAQSIGGYDARTLIFNAQNSVFCCGNLSHIIVS